MYNSFLFFPSFSLHLLFFFSLSSSYWPAGFIYHTYHTRYYYYYYYTTILLLYYYYITTCTTVVLYNHSSSLFLSLYFPFHQLLRPGWHGRQKLAGFEFEYKVYIYCMITFFTRTSWAMLYYSLQYFYFYFSPGNN